MSLQIVEAICCDAPPVAPWDEVDVGADGWEPTESEPLDVPAPHPAPTTDATTTDATVYRVPTRSRRYRAECPTDVYVILMNQRGAVAA